MEILNNSLCRSKSGPPPPPPPLPPTQCCSILEEKQHQSSGQETVSLITRITPSEMSSSKVKTKSSLWLLLGYSLVSLWLLVTIKCSQVLVLNKSSVLRRKRLICYAILLNLWNGLI